MTATATEINSLVEKIVALAGDMTPAELAQCKLLLGVAAGGLAPRGQAPVDPERAAALKTIIRSLAKLQPTGIAWHGKPDFISDGTLTSLRSEALARRRDAEQVDRYLLSGGRSCANELIASPSFKTFLKQNLAEMEPTGQATYIYYEGLGAGLDPHLDADAFSVNLILVLEHLFAGSPSNLIIYNSDGQAERFLIAPGEAVVLYAGSTIHAREDLNQGESVTLLTIGLKSQ